MFDNEIELPSVRGQTEPMKHVGTLYTVRDKILVVMSLPKSYFSTHSPYSFVKLHLTYCLLTLIFTS